MFQKVKTAYSEEDAVFALYKGILNLGQGCYELIQIFSPHDLTPIWENDLIDLFGSGQLGHGYI